MSASTLWTGPAPEGEENCGCDEVRRVKEAFGWLCTLKNGHAGRHEAWGTLGRTEPIIAWSDGEEFPSFCSDCRGKGGRKQVNEPLRSTLSCLT